VLLASLSVPLLSLRLTHLDTHEVEFAPLTTLDKEVALLLYMNSKDTNPWYLVDFARQNLQATTTIERLTAHFLSGSSCSAIRAMLASAEVVSIEFASLTHLSVLCAAVRGCGCFRAPTGRSKDSLPYAISSPPSAAYSAGRHRGVVLTACISKVWSHTYRWSSI
jgi:hypothetical protein